MFDLWREILQTISHNKLRMALTGFAVAWGIFMLMILLGLVQGMIHSFEGNMMSGSSRSIRIYSGMTSMPWKGYKDGRIIELRSGDPEAVLQENNKLTAASPSMSNDTVTFRYNNNSVGGGYTGLTPGNLAFSELEMTAGRKLNDNDEASQRKVVLLEESNARRLFGTSDSIVGRHIKALGLSWEVVGVYSHRWRSNIFIPYSTARAIAGNDERIDGIETVVGDISTAEEAEGVVNQIRSTLAKRHDFSPDDQGAIWIWDRFSDSLQAHGAMNIMVMAMWAIGILTLLSGIVGVSNIMFVSVKERTHEIGIRRAIGAKRRHILSQIVLESVAVTTIFGYIGIVLGTVTMAGISAAIGDSLEMLQNPTVDLPTAIRVTIVLIIAGALAGLFPALKATKVKPVEALRDE